VPGPQRTRSPPANREAAREGIAGATRLPAVMVSVSRAHGDRHEQTSRRADRHEAREQEHRGQASEHFRSFHGLKASLLLFASSRASASYPAVGGGGGGGEPAGGISGAAGTAGGGGAATYTCDGAQAQ